MLNLDIGSYVVSGFKLPISSAVERSVTGCNFFLFHIRSPDVLFEIKNPTVTSLFIMGFHLIVARSQIQIICPNTVSACSAPANRKEVLSL